MSEQEKKGGVNVYRLIEGMENGKWRKQGEGGSKTALYHKKNPDRIENRNSDSDSNKEKNRNDPDRAADRMGKRRVSEEKEGEWKPWLLLLTVNLTLYLKLHFKIFPLDDVPSFHFHLLVVLFLECCTSHPLIILTLVVLLLLVLLLTAAARFLTFFAEGGGG